MTVQQNKVRVSFDYYPDEPDPDDDTGMIEEEYMELQGQLSAIGADNIDVEKVS